MENMQIKSRSLFLFMLQMIIRWRLPHLWKKSPMTIHQRRRTKVTRKIYGSKLKQMYQWQRFKEKSIWRKNWCKLSNWGQVQLTNDDLHFLSDVGTTLAPSHWHHHHHHKLHHLSGWKAAPMINDDHKHHLFELRPTSPSNKCRIYSCNWPPKTYDDHHHYDHHIQLMMRMVRIPEVLK